MSGSSENKVYVGNLSHDTTTDSLRAHFQQYGNVADCIIMYDKDSGQSRGFGFVTFQDNSSVEPAVNAQHTIDGRLTSCKRAIRDTRKGERPQDDGAGSGLYNVVKIFVGGLPASCEVANLKDHFGQFGEIKDAVVMMDAATQRHRGFGFVTFMNASSVEMAITNDAGNVIDGKWVEVKRCMPQDVMRSGSGGATASGARGGGRSQDDAEHDSGSAPTPAALSPGHVPQVVPVPAAGYGVPPHGGPPGYGYPPAGAYGYYAGYYPGMPGVPPQAGMPGMPPGGAPPPGYGYGAYPYGMYPPPPGYPGMEAYGYPPGMPPPAFPGYPPMPTPARPEEPEKQKEKDRKKSKSRSRKKSKSRSRSRRRRRRG